MLRIDTISKTYRMLDVETRALDGVSLAVGSGEFVAIMGPSGCGKSTLLNIVGMLDQADAGRYEFGGHDVTGASQSRMTALRRASIGFVFQDFNLIDDLTVEENVQLALTYRRVRMGERRRRTRQILEEVGIAHRAGHLPNRLSGGQQQRVAIARALVGKPSLILADEPTGNLDTVNGDAVMVLLADAVRRGSTVLMVTHSLAYAAFAQRTVKMLDGRIVSETLMAA
ncbi:MAG TPA: ABC transporter ATP-binding protein [Steroidobacteraceae bacterium]|jgi:putative ABC transport system ATP-binding protein|nr:ABC transporter ATP-binding protein [Steroidobacteraceae bacterium]